MSWEPFDSRDQPFKDMLLAVSKQLSEHDVEQLKYLTECRCGCKPLELLTALRNKGMFSPINCAPLRDLLKKIERHDLADDVKNKYMTLYPDQELSTVPGPEQRRKRSSIDPGAMTTSIPSDLDSRSMPTDALTLQQEQLKKSANGTVPPNLTLLQKGAGDGTTSLDDIRPMCSSPNSPMSASYSTHRQHTDGRIFQFGLTRSRPGSTNTSQRSISQSSQEPYSSFSSSNGSCVSSVSSLPQGSITEAVLERTSAMLFDRVTADLQFCGYQFGLRTSYHGPHRSDPETSQLQLMTAHTMPRNNPPSSLTQSATISKEPIHGPTISEIYSDPEEDKGLENETGLSRRRGTLECPTGNVVCKSVCELPPSDTAYDDTTLRLKRKEKKSSDNERSRTPKALEQQLQAEHRELLALGIHQSPSHGKELAGESTDQALPPLNQPTKQSSKEKNWCKRIFFFSKNKSKRNDGSSFTWKVLRDDLSKPIWSHDGKRCFTRSHKLELNANLGRRNPKLSFQLYPYGESKDFGEFATMIVRITTSDKCPPLPSTSKVHISLVVRADSSDKDSSSCELNRCSIEEHLDLGYFRIHQVVKHDQLMKSHSKYIYFDMEAMCSGVELEGGSRKRLSTL